MGWNLKGRQAVASLDPATRYRITRSQTMAQCANKPLLWVLEELTRITAIGGLSGPLHKVEYFLCLLTRLLQIGPSPDIVLAMLRQELHKYVKVAALFVIRLIGNDVMVQEAVKLGLDDYRKIRVYGGNETPASLLATTGIKRPRDKDEKDGGSPAEEQGDQSDALNLEPPHYFILRMDEFAEGLFQLGQPRDMPRGKSVFLVGCYWKMSALDVEQMLQQLRTQGAANKYSGTVAAASSFMQWAHFLSVSRAAYFVLGASSMVALLSTACVVLSPKLRNCIQRGLERAKAGVLTSYFTAMTFTLLVSVWGVLIALSTVFSLMKMAAGRMGSSDTNQPLPEGLWGWLRTPPVLLFFPKLLGVFAVWLYALLLGGFLEIGVASSLLVCLPAFYESLCLSGKEPDRTAVWVTHAVFFISLFVAFCMGVPWLAREFHYSARQIQGYAAHVTYYNRQEYKELKNYKRVISRKSQ